MNSTSTSTPGVSSAAASSFSLSSIRVRRETLARSRGSAALAALPAPVTTGTLKAGWSLIDLGELASGRLDRCFRRHLAARRIRVHVDDDVLVPRLGGLLGRRAGEAHVPASAPRGPEWRHHRIGFPHLVLFPRGRGPDRETLLHDKPLLVVFRFMSPAQEFLGALHVLRVLHHHV